MDSAPARHLVLTTRFLLPVGGGEQVVVNTALAAQAHGYRVTVICRDPLRGGASNQYGLRLQAHQVHLIAPSQSTLDLVTGLLKVAKALALVFFPVYWAVKRTSVGPVWRRLNEELQYHLVNRPTHWILDRLLWRSLTQQHARHPIDVLHGQRVDWAMPVVTKWARSKGIPVIWHEHTNMPDPHESLEALWAYTGQDTAQLSEGCQVAVLSPALIPRALRVYASHTRIAPIGNWVEDPGVVAHPGQRKGMLALGVASRLAIRKGLEMLIQSIGHATQQGTEVRGVIMGGGPLLEPLKQQALQWQIASQVEFTGALQAEEVKQRLALLDVFVLVSEAEGMPMSVLEAMAMGLPILATPVGALPDLVQEGVNGFLVPVGDVEALTDRLCELASQPEMVQRMGQASRELYLANYTEEAAWPKLAALYDRLITEGRSPA